MAAASPTSRTARLTAVAAMVVTAILVIAVAATLPRPPDEDAVEPPELEGLAERVLSGGDREQAWHDLRALQQIRMEEAVPQLIEIVDTLGIRNTFGAAAAQALFISGTQEQAHPVLARHLLTLESDLYSGFRYGLVWNMREPERSAYYRRYLLQGISDDIDLTLKAHWRDGQGGLLIVELTLTNQTDAPLTISRPAHYRAMSLYFESPGGYIIPGETTVDYDARLPTPVELLPGESDSYRMSFTHQGPNSWRTQEGIVDWFSSGDVIFGLPEFGEYRIYAMLQRRPTDEHPGFRVLSEPATVRIGR